ncbi:MAG TPA: zf-TFIIB domain-containing protein [Candidatus Paceibacterota bacterium]|nr:zf-TFIIB domain-containing protein [Candidatus Paceibacterota bacterium]
MKCPACDTVLSRILVGTLELDACRGGCGGIWFDGYEFQHVDDVELPAETPLHIPHHIDAPPILTHRRECPACQQVKLKHNVFSPDVPTEVDECPSCGGFWMDAAALEQLHMERGRVQKNAAPSSGMSPAVIRTLYRLRMESCDDA